MTVIVGDQELLEQQADRIERALAALAVPARVAGGEVGEGWVRYHLTPLAAGQVRRLREASGALAEAVGAEGLRLARQVDGLSLELPHAPSGLRLLPLLDALAPMPPRTALAGLTPEGRPLHIDLSAPRTGHVAVLGPAGSGTSELLRSLAFSLALIARPAHLRLLGFDLGGRELAALEGLPHLYADLATAPQQALDLLRWAGAEVERRRAVGLLEPALVLVIDDLPSIAASVGGTLEALLHSLWQEGAAAGVHVLASGPLARALPAGGVRMRAQTNPTGPGRFIVEGAGESVGLRAAWLPAADLHEAVRAAQAGWVAGRALGGYCPGLRRRPASSRQATRGRCNETVTQAGGADVHREAAA